ncbi:MAG: four helix bundle protein [Parcubacteria group bacterium]|nr:four helix bundle protein [Parcubacteria group bacterium]
MTTKKRYILLKDLEVYQLARELSRIGWEIYSQLDWQTKKIMGDQFIEATDSIGANIAEGYSRYHYLEKIKFCYNARGSLGEALDHWIELLKERQKVTKENYDLYKSNAERVSIRLQNYITVLYRTRENSEQ